MRRVLFVLLLAIASPFARAQDPARLHGVYCGVKVDVYHTPFLPEHFGGQLKGLGIWGEAELGLKHIRRWAVEVPFYFFTYDIPVNSLDTSFKYTFFHSGIRPKFYIWDFNHPRPSGRGLALNVALLLERGHGPFNNRATSLLLEAGISWQFVFWKRLMVEPEFRLLDHLLRTRGFAEFFVFNLGYKFWKP